MCDDVSNHCRFTTVKCSFEKHILLSEQEKLPRTDDVLFSSQTTTSWGVVTLEVKPDMS
jgi:hypothetical protein